MRKLYLDDIRPCPVGWDCVRSYDAFVAYIQEFGVPDLISFDHDLSDEQYPKCHTDLSAPIDYTKYKEKTGYDCAKYLVDNDLGLNEWTVHSMNPVGRNNITFLLRSYERFLRNK